MRSPDRRGTIGVHWGRGLSLAIWVWFFGFSSASAAPTPSPQTDGSSGPQAAQGRDATSDGSRPKLATELHQRATRVRDLISGTLNIDVDPESLFAIDLNSPVLAIDGARRWLALVSGTSSYPAPEAGTKRPPNPPTEGRQPAAEPSAPPQTSASDPIGRAAEDLATAYAEFFALEPAKRRAVVAAHRDRKQAASQALRTKALLAQRAKALNQRAAHLEAFLANELDLKVDPTTLLQIDLLEPGELPTSRRRRKRLLDAFRSASAAPEPQAASRVDRTPVPEKVPSPDHPTGRAAPKPPSTDTATSVGQTPPSGAAATDGKTGDDSASQAPPSSTDSRELIDAEDRLDRARLAFIRLTQQQRKELFEHHKDRVAQAEQAQGLAAQQPDPIATETKAAIEDARQQAAQAGRERLIALDAAQKARTQTLRVIAEEKARLLGIKEEQALFAAELPGRKQTAAQVHEATLDWQRKVDELVDSRAFSDEIAAQADPMYFAMRESLTEARDHLRIALRKLGTPGGSAPAVQGQAGELSPDIDREELNTLRRELETRAFELRAEELEVGWKVARSLRDDVVTLNRARLTLLQAASDGLRSQMTGLGADGIDQVQRELDQIALELRYHALSLPHDLAELAASARRDPVRIAVKLVEFLLAFTLLRWWRRRADALLQSQEAQYRRRTTSGLRRTLGHVLWYTRRIRSPVESLLFISLIFYLIGDIEAIPELRLLWIVCAWSLSGWTAVLLLDAIAARQTMFSWQRTENSELRIQSLRLIGITVTTVGMLLSLTSEIVGRGAIYNWVWQTCWLLIAPIVIWMVRRWRETISERIEALPRKNRLLRWASRDNRGIARFAAAFVGGVYLLGLGVWQWTMRHFGELDSTRKVLAYLFRREVAKQAEATKARRHEEPIEQALYAGFDPGGVPEPTLGEICAKELEETLELTLVDTTTISAVIGERGAGKTVFLNRLVKMSQDTTCVIDCPPGGFGRLIAVLANEFTAEQETPQSVAAAIRDAGAAVVCIDDIQRMIQPAIGGLADLDRFTRFALEVSGDVSWVVSIESAAWRYVRRARGERVFFDQITELRRWNEEQIAKLIQTRTIALKLKPSFDELVKVQEVETGGPDDAARTELGYYRILWDHSNGNPGIALHAWRESLYAGDAPEAPQVHLFTEPSSAEIERLPLPLMFVLRAIVQLDLASEPEVVACTQLPPPDVADAIRFSITRGYVERVRDRVRLSWPWYRTITNVLARQHLLA